jgi:plastocyanin
LKNTDPTKIAVKQVVSFGIYGHPMGQRSLRSCAGLSVVITFLAAVPCLAEDQNGAAAGQASVTMDNFIFTPSEITVAPGTTVTWVNNEAMPLYLVKASVEMDR